MTILCMSTYGNIQYEDNILSPLIIGSIFKESFKSPVLVGPLSDGPGEHCRTDYSSGSFRGRNVGRNHSFLIGLVCSQSLQDGFVNPS